MEITCLGVIHSFELLLAPLPYGGRDPVHHAHVTTMFRARRPGLVIVGLAPSAQRFMETIGRQQHAPGRLLRVMRGGALTWQHRGCYHLAVTCSVGTQRAKNRSKRLIILV